MRKVSRRRFLKQAGAGALGATSGIAAISGLKFNFETIGGTDLQPSIASAIQSGAGGDPATIYSA
jgi:hypothetical protein